MGTGFLSGVMGMSWNYIVLMFAQCHEYTKTSELYTLKVTFMMWELYLNKAVT